MNDDVKAHFTNRRTWKQIFLIAVCGCAFCAAGWVAAIVVVAQVGWSLITGRTNERLRRFGGELGAYLGQLVAFMTHGSSFKPFPFGDWPGAGKLANLSSDVRG